MSDLKHRSNRKRKTAMLHRLPQLFPILEYYQPKSLVKVTELGYLALAHKINKLRATWAVPFQIKSQNILLLTSHKAKLTCSLLVWSKLDLFIQYLLSYPQNLRIHIKELFFGMPGQKFMDNFMGFISLTWTFYFMGHQIAARNFAVKRPRVYFGLGVVPSRAVRSYQ